MARLLFLADLALDDPFVGLADVSVEVARFLREAAETVLDHAVQFAVAAEVDALLLVGELARPGGDVTPGLGRLRAAIERCHRAGRPVVCVPVDGDATLGWTADDTPAGVVVLRPETPVTTVTDPQGNVVEVRRRAGSGAPHPALEVRITRPDDQHDPAGAATPVVVVGRGAAAAATDSADGSWQVVLGPAQPREVRPLEAETGAALVDIVAGAVPEERQTTVRFVPVEHVRVLDRTVVVPPVAPGDATEPSVVGRANGPGNQAGNDTEGSPKGAVEGGVEGGVDGGVEGGDAGARIVEALRRDAAAIAEQLPRRWLVARASVVGDASVRRALAVDRTRAAVVYQARLGTATDGIPLWWERVESAPADPARPVAAGGEALATAVRRHATTLVPTGTGGDPASTIVTAALGTAGGELPFDLAHVDAAAVTAAVELVVDLLAPMVTAGDRPSRAVSS